MRIVRGVPIRGSAGGAGGWCGPGGGRAAGSLRPLISLIGCISQRPGMYTFNTTAPNPTLTEPDGTTLTGIVSNGIAVFDFNSITVSSGQTLVGTGALPLALLSRGDATINGLINVSATPPQYYGQASAGGPGGGSGGNFGEFGPFGNGGGGPGGGGPGAVSLGSPGLSASSVSGGGGGFGGPGGAGAANGSLPGAPPVPGTETSRNNSKAAAAVARAA